MQASLISSGTEILAQGHLSPTCPLQMVLGPLLQMRKLRLRGNGTCPDFQDCTMGLGFSPRAASLELPLGQAPTCCQGPAPQLQLSWLKLDPPHC